MRFLYEQLPLAVQLRDEATFENFYAGDNGLAVNEISRQLQNGETYIFLCGPSGSGRSHLLQAACHHADQLGHASVYLPLDELSHYPPEELFAGLAALPLVCLDNISHVLGNAQWEEALFHLFNQMREADNCLLIAADKAVADLAITMPDLASRLGWGAFYQLKPLSDEQRIAVLKLRAVSRGLELSDEVAQYIYKRCQRNMEALLTTLAQLDRASLQERRKLTIPFVKEVLHW
ncbi:DnaA regulatory inactivator Hda [Dasania marina]|uniref:DnaA regulatory inactivator Hda n=1 Tax=Dasania marina TaxID=471499 RepID=UPI000476F79D|nr:DnaA regulatory inactivator Hda [Dasania marina]